MVSVRAHKLSCQGGRIRCVCGSGQCRVSTMGLTGSVAFGPLFRWCLACGGRIEVGPVIRCPAKKAVRVEKSRSPRGAAGWGELSGAVGESYVFSFGGACTESPQACVVQM